MNHSDTEGTGKSRTEVRNKSRENKRGAQGDGGDSAPIVFCPSPSWSSLCPLCLCGESSAEMTMRFPLSLATNMAGYMARKRLRREKRFPLVLMLEPLHACNLTCTGCGRIREYSQTIKEKLSVEECLASVDEAGAPIVSICGGEPMIYPEIGALTRGILRRRKHIYLCTNGMFIRKKLHEFRPTSRFFFNVHLDGLEETHDRMVERDGVFRAAVDGIVAARKAGFL